MSGIFINTCGCFVHTTRAITGVTCGLEFTLRSFLTPRCSTRLLLYISQRNSEQRAVLMKECLARQAVVMCEYGRRGEHGAHADTQKRISIAIWAERAPTIIIICLIHIISSWLALLPTSSTT